MGRQAGPFVFTGTVGGATGYKMNGEYFIKTKSEISRRRIREHDRFSNTRRNAKWFGEAVQLAKKVYRELPRNEQGQHTVWYPMRNRAQELVRKGMPEEEIVCLLRKEFVLHREWSMVNGETLNVKRETGRCESKSSTEQQLTDEIMLGRMINPGVELELIDQLASSTAFVRTVLHKKAESKEAVYVKAGRLRLRR